jgi:hypothetical protein
LLTGLRETSRKPLTTPLPWRLHAETASVP